MNILQILPALDVGGVERGTVDLARYLTLKGHKSVVVSGGGRLVRRLDEVGARHYLLPIGRKSPFTMALMIRRICDIIRKEEIHIVHARSRIPAIIGFIAAKITKTTFLTTAHGFYNKHLPSRAMSWGRFVIAASKEIARHMIEDFQTPYERIRLIPRGVDLNEFKFVDRYGSGEEEDHYRGKDFVIGMIARITPLKGHADFLRAVSIVTRAVPKVKVLIVGENPPSKARYREELDLLARRLAITDIVKYLGAREDVPDILSQLDVVVLPTRTPEAFGRVIIEAQAVGVPVVASRIGGILDIIRDGENGLLSLPEDPHSIADAILRIYKDRELARSMVLRARKDIEEKYTLVTMAEKTIEAYKEALSLKKILVIKMSALGDVILSTPSLRAIRKKFPDAVIKVLVGLASSDALRGCPYINDRIVHRQRSKYVDFKSFLDLASKLRREDFDIVIDLQNNKTSHLLAFLSMASLRYGYNNGKWSFFLNRRVEDVKVPLEPIEHQFRTLRLLGIERGTKTLELWPSKEDERWAEDFLKENWMGPKHLLVGINVGASKRWQSKIWETAYIAQLCDELATRYNIRTLITGSEDDMKLTKEVTKKTSGKPIISVGKTDVLQLASLIKRCKVYVSTDSAPIHIAASMNVQFVALFGPTDPKRHMPAARSYKILKSNIRCSPCYKPVCNKKNRCMKRIKVEDVLYAVKEFLEIRSKEQNDLTESLQLEESSQGASNR